MVIDLERSSEILAIFLKRNLLERALLEKRELQLKVKLERRK